MTGSVEDADNNGLVDNATKYQIFKDGNALTIEKSSGIPFLSDQTSLYAITQAVEDQANNQFDLLVEGTGVLEDKYAVWSTDSKGMITEISSWNDSDQMSKNGYEQIFTTDFNSNGLIDSQAGMS